MRIGPHEVVGRLGQGGAGLVYAARPDAGGTPTLAIKVLHRVDGDALARFERETRLLATLGEADGFVPLLETGTCPSGPYLVMPFLRGGTLRARLASGPLEIEEALDLARRLAAAVARAHERGIVHRDLKPENVLFTAEGEPLVADLGLAKHFDRDRAGAGASVSLTRDGALHGTAGYMAPEQMADARSAGPAADVFALGAIVYECLAGEPPFVAANLVELLTRVDAGRFEPVRARRREVPAWLAAVVERALTRSPDARYPDARALAVALAGPRRSRAPAVALGGALLAVAAIVAWRYAGSDARSRSVALGEAGNACRDAGNHAGALAFHDAAVAADPERAAAYLGRGAARAQLGWIDAALNDMDRAIALDPRSGEAYLDRGFWRSRALDHRGAIADFTRAASLPLPPREIARALDNRGIERSQLEDLDGSLADHRAALEVDPSFGRAWVGVALVQRRRGESLAAVAAATMALSRDPGDTQAWIVRADARVSAGDPHGALSDASRAIELAPSAAGGWATRARAKIDAGDLDGAIADATRGIALDSGSPNARHLRALARGRKGDVEGAITDYTAAIEARPTFAAAWRGRSLARLDARDAEGAHEDAVRATQLDPRDALSWHVRGAAAVALGRWEEAIPALDRAIALAPAFVLSYEARGSARERAGDAAGAIADYERFLELAPEHPGAARARERLRALKDG